MHLARQFTLFSLVGVAAAVGHYGTLIALTGSGTTGPVVASLAGYILGAIISYALNYRYTFRSAKGHREALIKFLIVAGVGFVLNGLAMALLTGPVALHYLLAQFVATVVVMVWTFTANRGWTFGAPPSD
jgi:putative flippase GtrA